MDAFLVEVESSQTADELIESNDEFVVRSSKLSHPDVDEHEIVCAGAVVDEARESLLSNCKVSEEAGAHRPSDVCRVHASDASVQRKGDVRPHRLAEFFWGSRSVDELWEH